MKKLVVSIITILILLIGLIAFRVISVRNEFNQYLKVNYPNNKFHIEIPKLDFIYGSYYSDVFCIDDSVSFIISKSWDTKKISEQYSIIKNQEEISFEIKEMFKGTNVEKYINSASGGGKIPTTEKHNYGEMYIGILPDSDMIAVTKDILTILKENKIVVNDIYITYEKDKGVYEGRFSDKDYDLTLSEIKDRFVRLK